MKTLIGLLGLTALGFLSIGSAYAEIVPIPIKKLGLFPFEGTQTEACELHVKAHGKVTFEECVKALTLADNGHVCKVSPILQDGTDWWMLFTSSSGVHKITLVRIDFGPEVPLDDPMRMANDCSKVSGTVAFNKPLACGNYAFPRHIKVVTPETPRIPKTRLVCQSVPIQSAQGTPGYSQYTPGISLGSSCGNNIYYGGTSTYVQGDNHKSSGRTQICRMVPIP